MGRRFFWVGLVCLGLTACAVPFQGGPKPEEMAKADFGRAPEDPEAGILSWMNDHLKDPFTAKLEIIAPAEKGWWGNPGGLLYARDIHYCWMVKARINAKNSYGGYIGWKAYNFFFRDGTIEFVQE